MTRCLLCDQANGANAIVVRTGNVTQPDLAIVCGRCAALPVSEQARRRDAAMARLLRGAT